MVRKEVGCRWSAPVWEVALGLGLVAGATAAPASADPGEPAPAASTSQQAAVPVDVQVASTPARAGATTRVTLLLVDAAGAGVPGVGLRLQRWDGSAWRPAATLATDGAGRASWEAVVDRAPDRNRLRVVIDREGREPSLVPHDLVLVRTPTVVEVVAPAKVVDEKKATLTVRWRTDDGQPVTGRVVVQKQSKRSGRWTAWSTARTLTTGGDGTARTSVTPRWSTRWRAVADPMPWAEGARSAQEKTKNVPPGKPVVLPKGAPRPRITLKPQPRAVGKGANVTVSKIPDKVWKEMKGRSWHRGCPLGRKDLRLIRTNYYAFDGYRRRGELVVAASARTQFVRVLRDLHDNKVPIRSMRRVDRFGWSKKLKGADDHRSMAADNTSAFNCRQVVGNPKARSPHSYGRSFDVNPWENPYNSRQGWVPHTWWVSRSHKQVAWRSADHEVVRIMRANGFRWTYGRSDAHHFDAVGGADSSGRGLAELLTSEACTTQVCH